MIHPHTNLKFKVEITAEGFSQENDPWAVLVRDQFKRIQFNVDKEDCIRDSEGGFYFLFADAPTGIYEAITTTNIPDDDYDDGYMVMTDRQHLVSVGFSHWQHKGCCCKTEGVTVTFTRVFTVNIDDASYLCDCNGELILTADGRRIKFPDTVPQINEQTPTPNTEES